MRPIALLLALTTNLFAQQSTSNNSNGSVLLLSGGGSPTSNNQRYYTNLEMGQQYFSGQWGMHTLAANGGNSTIPNYALGDEMGAPVFDERGFTQVGIKKSSDLPKGIQGEASKAAIKAALKKLVNETPPDKPIMFYVTDHGSAGDGPDNRAIVLWDGQKLSANELREILQEVPANRKLIMVNDQCFGGGMLESMFDGNGFPLHPGLCGFAAASTSEVATSGGGFMETLNAHRLMPSQINASTFGDIYQHLKQRSYTSSTDEFGDDNRGTRYDPNSFRTEVSSSPVSTSTLFSFKYLAKMNNEISPFDATNICSGQQLLTLHPDLVNLIPVAEFTPLYKRLGKIKASFPDNAEQCLSADESPLMDAYDLSNLDAINILKDVGINQEQGLNSIHAEEAKYTEQGKLYKNATKDYLKTLPLYSKWKQLKDKITALHNIQARTNLNEIQSKELAQLNLEFAPISLEMDQIKKAIEVKPAVQKYIKAISFCETNPAGTPIPSFDNEKECSESLSQKMSEKLSEKGIRGERLQHARNFISHVENHPAVTPPEDDYPKTILKDYFEAQKAWTEAERLNRTCRRFADQLAEYAAIQAMMKKKDSSAIQKYLKVLECEETPLP